MAATFGSFERDRIAFENLQIINKVDLGLNNFERTARCKKLNQRFDLRKDTERVDLKILLSHSNHPRRIKLDLFDTIRHIYLVSPMS